MNSLSPSPTQYQAGQAEERIREQFASLHLALEAEEAARLKALAIEEEQKVNVVQELAENTKRDIIDLKKLIENLKREMGNEDLPLLQVKST